MDQEFRKSATLPLVDHCHGTYFVLEASLHSFSLALVHQFRFLRKRVFVANSAFLVSSVHFVDVRHYFQVVTVEYRTLRIVVLKDHFLRSIKGSTSLPTIPKLI